MKSLNSILIVTLFMVLTVFGPGLVLAEETEGPEIKSEPPQNVRAKAAGGTIINFSLRELDGEMFNIRDVLGKKVILLNFWATWCIPCQQEFPHLEKLHQKYGTDDFLMLAINCDSPSTFSRVRPFIKRHNYTFKVLMDMGSQVVNQFNPKVTLPFSVLIDKNKKVVYQHDGYQSGDEKKLEELIKNLVRQGAAH